MKGALGAELALVGQLYALGTRTLIIGCVLGTQLDIGADIIVLILVILIVVLLIGTCLGTGRLLGNNGWYSWRRFLSFTQCSWRRCRAAHILFRGAFSCKIERGKMNL